MNTQAKQVVYTPVDIDDAEYSEYVDPKMAQENEEFEAFKSEMHDAQFDAKITVGKKLTDSAGRPLGRQVFECFECGIDDYTFSQLCTRIREDFGTGLYKIQGRDSKGKFKFDKTIGILAPNKTDNVPAGNDVGALIDKFSDALAKQQMQTEAMIKEFAGPRTGSDAFQQMSVMFTAMGNMMKGFGFQPQQQPPQKTLLDQLTEYKMMKELFGNDSDGGGEANLFSLLTESVKSFGPALAMAISQGKQSGVIPAKGPIQPLLANPQTEQEQETMTQQLQDMKPQIDFLVMQAKTQADAKLVAETLLPNIPETAYESIEAFLLQENVIEICTQVNAEVATFREWFETWRNKMLDLLTEKLDGPIDDETEPEAPLPDAGKGLTGAPENAQTPEIDVAGDATESNISASSEPNGDTGDTQGDS